MGITTAGTQAWRPAGKPGLPDTPAIPQRALIASKPRQAARIVICLLSVRIRANKGSAESFVLY